MIRKLRWLVMIVPVAALCQTPARALSPAEFWRLRTQADSLAAVGNSAQAVILYRRLVRTDSQDVQLWLSLATTESGVHHIAEAESAFVHVFAGGYFRGPTAVQIARASALRGDRARALDWLDSALVYRVASRASIQRDSSFAMLVDDDRFRVIAGTLPRRQLSRDAGWRYDLAFFAAEARRIHTGVERPAFSQQFADAVAQLNRAIPQLNDDQILAGLQHIATMLGDGHSGLYRRTLTKNRRRLPVDFYCFTDGLYIVGARDDYRPLVGHRVVRIGKLTADQAVAALASYVPRDNPMRIVGFGVPFFLSYPFQLQAIGAIDDTAHTPLLLEDAARSRAEVVLVANDSRLPQVKLMPRDTGSSNPLWLRNVNANISMTFLPALRALYVQYNAAADAPNLTIANFAQRLRVAASDSGVRNLIVDLRRNGGGNSFLNRPLLQAMFGFAQEAPDHRIWMLIGRHTFSAAQNFANYVERFTDAVFVGEPTGSRPNFTGENGEVVLPYSGVIAEISNENHWSSSWEDQRPWIAPTVPVQLTAADYFSNRDPVMDAVAELIHHAASKN